jgi:hypothetical protein
VAEELIGLSTWLAQEQDIPSLLDRVLSAARRLAHAEAGRNYTLDNLKRVLQRPFCKMTWLRAPARHCEAVPLSVAGKVNLRHVCALLRRDRPIGEHRRHLQHLELRLSGRLSFRPAHSDPHASMYTVSLRNHEKQTVGILQL